MSSYSAGSASRWKSERPIAHIAADLGMHPETLRKRIRQHEADSGARPARPTSEELDEIRRLRKENFVLRRASKILKSYTREVARSDRAAATESCRARGRWIFMRHQYALVHSDDYPAR